jgi:hypothetical protein
MEKRTPRTAGDFRGSPVVGRGGGPIRTQGEVISLMSYLAVAEQTDHIWVISLMSYLAVAEQTDHIWVISLMSYLAVAEQTDHLRNRLNIYRGGFPIVSDFRSV